MPVSIDMTLKISANQVEQFFPLKPCRPLLSGHHRPRGIGISLILHEIGMLIVQSTCTVKIKPPGQRKIKSKHSNNLVSRGRVFLGALRLISDLLSLSFGAAD